MFQKINKSKTLIITTISIIFLSFLISAFLILKNSPFTFNEQTVRMSTTLQIKSICILVVSASLQIYPLKLLLNFLNNIDCKNIFTSANIKLLEQIVKLIITNIIFSILTGVSYQAFFKYEYYQTSINKGLIDSTGLYIEFSPSIMLFITIVIILKTVITVIKEGTILKEEIELTV